MCKGLLVMDLEVHADRIREAREASSLSQEELARLSYVSVKTIWRLENGMTRRPPSSTVERIALVTDRDVGFFTFGGRDVTQELRARKTLGHVRALVRNLDLNRDGELVA